MTVKELYEQNLESGVLVELIPFSWERTNGESKIPFTFMPNDIKNLEGNEYKKQLFSKEVVKYEVMEVRENHTFSITGRYKGKYYTKSIYIWLHDDESASAAGRA